MNSFLSIETSEKIYNLLFKLADVTQKEEYHPEIYVLQHTYQVFKWAIRETNDIDLILAALLHDVGKSENKLFHVEKGVKMIEDFSSYKTVWLVKNHMRIWTYILGEMSGLKKCIELANHPWLPELIQLARWDKKGRSATNKTYFPWDEVLRILNEKAEKHFTNLGDKNWI